MSHVPHELAEEFPESKDQIHSLTQSDAHFAKLAEEYHSINREIHRIVDEDPSPSDKLIQEQNLAQLKAYISQLKPHYQEIINLRYFQELSYKEMAEQLDEPMSNIKVKLLRAKKLLAEIFIKE